MFRSPKALVAVPAIAGALVFAGSSAASAMVAFDGSPAAKAPPKTLHGLKMHKFRADSRTVGVGVSSVSGPTGKVSFSGTPLHERVGRHRGWNTWSHNYHGDVYYVKGGTLTLTLPAKTSAFYLYVEPNYYTFFTVRATSAGVSSGPVTVNGHAGAKYFGFYASHGGHLKTITVRCTDGHGFAIGEFGIH